MGVIFLSHIINDVDTMEKIARGLEEAGYPTWYFERDVLPGTSYLIQIAGAIQDSDAVILIVTPGALASDQVTKEVVGAFERGIPIFPLLIGVRPSKLKEKQPEWRHALGGTAMTLASQDTLQEAVARILDGLKLAGVEPSFQATGRATYTPGARVLPGGPSAEGERKQVTVLFADVAGFTSISEELDPEELSDLMKPCVDIMTEEIHRYEGTIAQFLGDGLMALFGAPIAHEDAPQRAIRAGLAIQERLSSYAGELSGKGISFEMRMGLNTGLVVTGRVGDDLTMEYTALGDTVNLASRMESTAEPGTVQVSESTYELTRGYFDFKELGEVEVKGKKKPVKAYRVLSPKEAKTRMEASLPAGLSTFVGRTHELVQLTECYTRLKDLQGQVVGIVGEPGVGKSRLILEFRESLPVEECTYLEGGCFHYGESIPYLPILEVVKEYFDIEETDEESSVKDKLRQRLYSLDPQLETSISPLEELLSLKVEDEAYLSLDPKVRRQLVFETIRNLLVTLSHERPLVLTVEDLHWIDKTSEDFLSYLIDSIAGVQIFLLLLYRPEYTSPWTSKTYWTQLSLTQLSQDTSSILISSILTDAKVSDEILDLIVSRTAGNPLFIEEMTHALRESGAIQRDNGSYVLSGEVSSLQVPDTVQGIIASRLDRLEDDSKRIMQTASVIGREFVYRLLEAISSKKEELKERLSSLQSLEFIYEKSLFPELEYIFKHALTQEVAYESLLKKKRKEIHGAIGRAIESLYPERLEEFYEILAHHYSRSDYNEKAVHYLRLAGEKAARSFSNWEAISFYKEAIRLLDEQPETAENKRKKLKISLAVQSPLFVLSFPEGSLDLLKGAEELSRDLGDNRSLVSVFRRMSTYHSYKGNTELALEYSENSFYEAEKLGEVTWMAKTASDICLARYLTGNVKGVIDVASRFLNMLDKQAQNKDLLIGEFSLATFLSAWYGISLSFLGDFDGAEAVIEKGLLRCVEMNDKWGIGWLELFRLPALILCGKADAVVDHARKALPYLKEAGAESLVGIAYTAQGMGLSMLGEHVEATDCVTKGIEKEKKAGMAAGLPLCYWFTALVHLSAGDFESAMEYAEEASRLCEEFEHRIYDGCVDITLGRIVAEVNDSQYDAAEEHIRRGLATVEKQGFRPLSAQGHLFLGEVLNLAGRRDEATENLKLSESECLVMDMTPESYWLTRTRDALSRLDASA